MFRAWGSGRLQRWKRRIFAVMVSFQVNEKFRPRAKTKANGAYARAGYPLALRFYNDALEAVTEDDSEVAAQLRSNMSENQPPKILNPKP